MTAKLPENNQPPKDDWMPKALVHPALAKTAPKGDAFYSPSRGNVEGARPAV